MKQGKISKRHQVAVTQAVQAWLNVGLSQVEFAKLLGVSACTLQAWKRGKKSIKEGYHTVKNCQSKLFVAYFSFS